MEKRSLIAVLLCIFAGMVCCTTITLGASIIIASSPTSKILQHDLSLLNNSTDVIGESQSLNETESSMNNAVQNLSWFNAVAIVIIVFSAAVVSIIFLFYRKDLNKLKQTPRLGDASNITIALLFGLMVLFYTSADITNLSQEQTITQVLSTIMTSDKNHDQQIKLLGDFIMDKIGQYRINIENSIFFGLLTITMLVNLLMHKIKPDSTVPLIVFFIVLGSILLWAEGFMINPEHSQPFVSCVKVHC